MPILIIAALVVLLPLIYTSDTLDPTQPLRFLIISVALTLLSALLLWRLRHHRETSEWSVLKSFIFPACGIYALISAVSVAQAINFAEAIYDLAKVFLMLALLICSSLVFASDKRSLRILTRSMIISGFLLAAIGACQYYGIAFSSIPGNVIPYGTMANKNLLACILCLALPFALYESIGQNRGWSIAGLVGALLSLFVIILGQTRAAWLGLMIATVIVTPVYFIWVRKSTVSHVTKRSRRARVAVMAAIALLILLAAGSGIILREGQYSIAERLASIFTHQDSSSQIRLAVWQKSWELCQQNPITGVGIGNWKIACPGLGLTGTRAETADLYFQQPHNDYLWVLAETGVMGLAAYLLIFALAIVYAFRIILRNPTRDEASLALFIMFAVIYYLVDSFFSYPRERVELIMMFTLVLAAISALYNRVYPPQRKLPRVVSVSVMTICLLMSLAASLLGIIRLKGELHIRGIWSAKSSGNWQEVIRQVDLARSHWLTVDPTAAPLAWYRGVAQSSLGHRERACQDFALALRDNPYHPHVLNNLGTCAELDGDHRRALEHYDQAIKIAPRFNEAWLNLTAVYYNMGDLQRADSALSHVDPNFNDPRVSSFKQMISDKIKPAQVPTGN